ncbi:MAG: Extracellular ligand-binding receptor [Frankiales bacterium]|jgi:branched-chain amino acid transport system substrate-binding protein|nr:Extracellular ligand-binding receptor [Frankiales bacterium]
MTMLRGSRWGLTVAAVAMLTATAACGNSAAKTADSGSGKAAASSTNEVIIGAAVAKTGGQTFYGGPAMIAAQAAIKDINAKGGIGGKQIKLVWEDSQTDFAKSAAAAETVLNKGAQVLLVDCDFDYGLPAAQVAQKRGVVAMNLCAGSPRAGDPRLLPMGFSMGVATNVEAAAMAQYAYDKLGYKKVYQLRDNSIEYSKSVCDYFKSAFTKLGGTVSEEDSFNNADTSIQAQVSKLRGSQGKYDAINICSYPPGLTTAVRQIRAAGVTSPLLGSVTWDGDFWLGPKGAGQLSDVYFPAYGSLYGDDPRPEANALIAKVRTEMGSVPFTSFTLPGYSAVEALAKGIEKAGTTDGTKLVAALESFKDEKLLIGPVSYSAQSHARTQGAIDVTIMQIDAGKPKFVGIVQPKVVPAP